MHVMFGFLHAFTCQHAFALLMDLQHVKLRLFSVPAKDLLKDMRDVIHEIYGVIPANNQVTRFQIGYVLLFRGSIRNHLRNGNLTHN